MPDNSLKPVLTGVFDSGHDYSPRFDWDKCVGAYYDSERDRFFMGTNFARILCFEHRKGLNNRFDSKLAKFRHYQIAEARQTGMKVSEKIERGTYFYFDNDHRIITLIGSLVIHASICSRQPKKNVQFFC